MSYQYLKRKCRHNKISKDINEKYLFCENCGSLIIKDNLDLYNTIKPLSMEKKINESPIKIYESMTKRNLKINDSLITENTYLKNRKNIILLLHKLKIKMKYSDSTFYRSLYYLDNNLKNISYLNYKQILYYTISFFIISGKFNENDIFEADLNEFLNIEKKINLQINELVNYEILSLKLINYNLINYSTFDWLMIILNNGFIFEDEISQKNYFIINNTYNFIKKCLSDITDKNLFFLYNPFIIAFSLIHIGREKFISEEEGKFKFIKNFYNVNFTDYEKCYNEIKNELFNLDKALTINNSKKISFQVSPILKSDKKKLFNRCSIDCYKTSEIPNLFFNNNKNEEINEIERKKTKTKTVKIENKIDLNDKRKNNSKSKNDFVNDINKISKGTFSEKHPIVRRQNNNIGTIIIKKEESKKFKDKISSQNKGRNLSEPKIKKKTIYNNYSYSKFKSSQKLPSLKKYM